MREINIPLAMLAADLFEQAIHNPGDASVVSAYAAFKRQTLAQFLLLRRLGITVEGWKADGQPYANSGEMRSDIRDNNHLYIFLGGEFMPNHPLCEEAIDGFSYNDCFRAVHDFFAHYKTGFGFGARGEWNGAIAHARMYTTEALPALFSETVMQNSFVNFGSHMRDENGALLDKADARYLMPDVRPFAVQKVFPVDAKLVKTWHEHCFR